MVYGLIGDTLTSTTGVTPYLTDPLTVPFPHSRADRVHALETEPLEFSHVSPKKQGVL